MCCTFFSDRYKVLVMIACRGAVAVCCSGWDVHRNERKKWLYKFGPCVKVDIERPQEGGHVPKGEEVFCRMYSPCCTRWPQRRAQNRRPYFGFNGKKTKGIYKKVNSEGGTRSDRDHDYSVNKSVHLDNAAGWSRLLDSPLSKIKQSLFQFLF